MVQIFNKILYTEKVPTDWKIARILTNNNILTTSNWTELLGEKTAYPIHILNNIIEYARKYIRKAFDSVNKNLITVALQRIKLPKNIITIINEIINDRVNFDVKGKNIVLGEETVVAKGRNEVVRYLKIWISEKVKKDHQKNIILRNEQTKKLNLKIRSLFKSKCKLNRAAPNSLVHLQMDYYVFNIVDRQIQLYTRELMCNVKNEQTKFDKHNYTDTITTTTKSHMKSQINAQHETQVSIFNSHKHLIVAENNIREKILTTQKSLLGFATLDIYTDGFLQNIESTTQKGNPDRKTKMEIRLVICSVGRSARFLY
ncbi:hypothetical protein Glove_186g5 [Diversispora epigaea]|uniref:Uncharacterized protein n=1 Tax=Diversispora epigaea TaxID=1348612 RepID=A0A397IMF1_9GLOM|nr:hypothetical protein Glove_186g5 [Diversispora epigaea]